MSASIIFEYYYFKSFLNLKDGKAEMFSEKCMCIGVRLISI